MDATDHFLEKSVFIPGIPIFYNLGLAARRFLLFL
jgi:hypothetical protein